MRAPENEGSPMRGRVDGFRSPGRGLSDGGSRPAETCRTATERRERKEEGERGAYGQKYVGSWVGRGGRGTSPAGAPVSEAGSRGWLKKARERKWEEPIF